MFFLLWVWDFGSFKGLAGVGSYLLWFGVRGEAYFRAVEDRAKMSFSAILHSNSRASGRGREWVDRHKRNRVSSTHAQKRRARV